MANLAWARRVHIDYTKITDLKPLQKRPVLEELSSKRVKLPKVNKKEVPLDLTPLKDVAKLKSRDL